MITNVLELLENCALDSPDSIALRDENESVTYAQYMDYAKRIGTFLREKHPQEVQRPVAVYIDRNIKSIYTFMGVVYSGNMYVPIDATMPEERVQLILKTLNPFALLDARNAKSESSSETDSLIPVDGILDETKVNQELLDEVRANHIDVDPLYSIFTSGSTGVPKGVCICHRSVIDLVNSFEEAFAFEKGTVFGNQAPFDFDVSVKDIFNALNCCGCVDVIPKKCFTSPALLVKHLIYHEIDTIIWAVSAMRILADFDAFKSAEVLPRIKNAFFSGEVMPVKTMNYWRKYYPNTRFVNLYGPTEITCNCSYYVVDKDFGLDEKIPAGKPFKNTRMYLINDKNEFITEPNVIGEICVYGTSLALGYWNNKEKTAEAFASNPFISQYPATIYRTGDLGYYDAEGNFVYSSRKDFQIKHMGHRIELGEIENALNSLDIITIAVCIYDEDKEKIVCFYQAAEERKKDIVMALSKKLPKYMWPNVYCRYDELPLNKNGKIDRTRLKKEWKKQNG